VSSSLSITLGELSEKIGALLKGDADTIVRGLSSLKDAQKDQVSFVSRAKYLPDLENTNAAAVILSEDHSEEFIGNKLIGNNPYLLYAKASKVFKELVRPSEEPGISKNTEISNSSLVHDSATIGPFTTISANSKISENVSIGSGSFVGKNVSIGSGTIIHPNVSIYDSVEIGSDCIIHSGTVIGSDGLGFAKENNKWFKIEHLGKVIIHDEVGVQLEIL
jgi:UDP-3-O-[3-hydroxymyristoyl] glucosamine N-acyltransferase